MFLLQGDHKCHGELFATLYSLLAVRSSWLFATCYQLLALGSVSKNARWPAPCAASGGLRPLPARDHTRPGGGSRGSRAWPVRVHGAAVGRSVTGGRVERDHHVAQ